MRPMLRTALLTLAALTALTAALSAAPSARYGGPPLSVPLPAAPQVPVGDVEALTVAYGLSSNSHGAPHPSAQTVFATAPELRPELQHAYWLAVHSAPTGCRPSFGLLAAIGMVESDSLVGHYIDSGNRVAPALIGAALDGNGLPSVPDTDAGQLDHDPVWDRPLGPMALVPEVWRAAAVDMDGDGSRDPQNVFDAAGAAMVYLCAENRDLSTTRGLRQAVNSYNDVPGYLALVLTWKAAYDRRQEDQMLTMQAVWGIVSPFPSGSQAKLRDGLISRAVTASSEPHRGPVTAGAQPPATATGVVPGLATGTQPSSPSPSSPAAAEPSPSPSSPVTALPSPPATRPSGPDLTPMPTTEPPAAPPDPTPHGPPDPGEPTPAPTPEPTLAPDPNPTCVVAPAEVVGVDATTTPIDSPFLCLSEVEPVEPVPTG